MQGQGFRASDNFTTAVAVVVTVSLLLDAPWGRAFYEAQPWTETLGLYWFASLTKAFAIPAVSLSLFEISSLSLAVVAYSKSTRQAGLSTSSLALLLAIPLIVALGVGTGIFRGNDLGLALTQTRSLAMLPAWMMIGYGVATSSPSASLLVFRCLVSAMVFKSLQAIWIHYDFFGGLQGDREFLVEHITSDFLTTAILAAIGLALIARRRVGAMALAAVACVPMGFVLHLNDRRAAVVGLGLALLMLPFAVPRDIIRRHWPKAAALTACALLLLMATWETEGTLGYAARTVRTLLDPNESSAGYRRIENANLLVAVASDPLTGIGFGQRFPTIFPLPDISTIYADYDLIPHNTLLYLWTFAGPLGIAAFGLFFAVCLAASARLGRLAPKVNTRLVGVLSFVCLIKWLVYVYADLGLTEVRALALVGLALGGVVRLSFPGRVRLDAPSSISSRVGAAAAPAVAGGVWP